MLRAEEQVILSAQTHRSQRVFRSRRRPNTSGYGTGQPACIWRDSIPAGVGENQLPAFLMAAWICSAVAAPGKTVMVFGVALFTGITISPGVPVSPSV